MDLDIFQRVCLKEGIPIEMSEEYEPELLEEAEEGEAYERPPKPLDFKALEAELRCMRKRILKLQEKLQEMHLDACPDMSCIEPVVLSCSEQLEIRELQKSHHKLQCQIYELIRCFKVAKDQIKDLRERMCDRSKEIKQLQEMVELLEHWRITLDQEFGKCSDRFDYSKEVKADWKFVNYTFEQQTKSFEDLEKKFVPKETFVNDKTDFIRQLEDMKNLFQTFHDQQTIRFNCLETRLLNLERPPRITPEEAEQLKNAMKETPFKCI